MYFPSIDLSTLKRVQLYPKGASFSTGLQHRQTYCILRNLSSIDNISHYSVIVCKVCIVLVGALGCIFSLKEPQPTMPVQAARQAGRRDYPNSSYIMRSFNRQRQATYYINGGFALRGLPIYRSTDIFGEGRTHLKSSRRGPREKTSTAFLVARKDCRRITQGVGPCSSTYLATAVCHESLSHAAWTCVDGGRQR